jgi:hypothetical protein
MPHVQGPGRPAVIRYRCERVPGLQPLGGPAHAPCPQCRRLTLNEQAEVVAGLFVAEYRAWSMDEQPDRDIVVAVVRELLERKVIE